MSWIKSVTGGTREDLLEANAENVDRRSEKLTWKSRGLVVG